MSTDLGRCPGVALGTHKLITDRRVVGAHITCEFCSLRIKPPHPLRYGGRPLLRIKNYFWYSGLRIKSRFSLAGLRLKRIGGRRLLYFVVYLIAVVLGFLLIIPMGG